jgi:hypothetical protein
MYNKDGFNTIMSVKTKLLHEEAVVTSKLKHKDYKKVSFASTLGETEKNDEIALVSALQIQKKKTKKEPPAPAPDNPNDNALLVKGKGGKGGKNNRWNQPGDWNSN